MATKYLGAILILQKTGGNSLIVDHINNYRRYLGCDKNIAAVLQFIVEKADDATLENGIYTLIPNEVIVHVLEKESHARTDTKMEIHKNFMDIHYIIKGAERCGIAPLAEQINYDEKTDNGFYPCEDTYDVLIREGEFYAVWPMEPHRPLCNAEDGEKTVRKIICKVKVDEKR